MTADPSRRRPGDGAGCLALVGAVALLVGGAAWLALGTTGLVVWGVVVVVLAIAAGVAGSVDDGRRRRASQPDPLLRERPELLIRLDPVRDALRADHPALARSELRTAAPWLSRTEQEALLSRLAAEIAAERG
jgi:hypothetical protein